ncbi:glycosyltransferase 87 family protein [Saccharothrix texasensis]|uniref:Alpha-1,2-mannosyltransferase n=1 Tax=Saccharothrix texasensis TaxID=103734 RepID=A0A3N1H0F3_9PSEU|nr:glycosyltransferase 87 family protein [Saccharothrix texasensis]ROP36023.1 alpha-1,2-mannosyltransferase [Saccharothrix texasensis]
MTRTEVPEHPATTNRLSAGIVVAALAIAAAVTAVLVAAIAQPHPLWLIGPDFRVYHVAGSAVLHGISPYDVATAEGYPFTYPPFGAVVLSVLGLAGVPVAFAGWTFVNVLALEAAIWLALGLVAPRSRDRRAKVALLAAVAALPLAPVMLNFTVGQINILLLLLLVADLTRRTGRFQGVAIGIAAGIKLLPLIFIAYLLFTRRVRAAAVASATFAATVLVGFLVLPGPSARWAGGLVVDIGRMMTPGAAPFNQSIRGVLAHLPGVLSTQWFWLASAVPVGVAGLAVAAWASRRGLEAVGIFTCAVTGLLVSPVSWPFHWVWAAPGLAVWLWWAWRRSAAHVAGAALTWLVLAASGVLTFVIAVGAPTQTSAGEVMAGTLTTVIVLNSLTVVAGIVFLAALAVALRRAERRPGPLTSPS